MKFKALVWISVAGIMVVHPVQAQQAPVEYTFKVRAVDMDKIGKGLAKLPFEDVADLMQSLRNQVIEQQQAANKPVEEKKDATTPSKP